MKKILSVLLLVVIALSFAACRPKNSLDLKDYVSYYQTHLYTGSNDNFTVSVTVGSKENPFIADGKSGDVSEFATVNVVPHNLSLGNKTIGFALVTDNGEVSGELKRDPVRQGLSASVELGSLKDSVSAIKLYYDDKTVEIPLENRLADMLTWEEALEIAGKEFADLIKSNLDENGELKREIFIKFIRDRRNPQSPYYWYVSFVGEEGTDYWAVLIEPQSGEIITKKQ